MARPRGGDWLENELTFLRRADVDTIVSLLTKDEEVELQLTEEQTACAIAGMSFHQFCITDRDTPLSAQAFQSFIQELRHEWVGGRNLAVHCRAGIGRASVTLAGLLVTEGFPVEEAFRIIGAARGLSVPDTPEQVEWVRRLSAR